VVRCELEAAALLERSRLWAICPRLELTMLAAGCPSVTPDAGVPQLGMRVHSTRDVPAALVWPPAVQGGWGGARGLRAGGRRESHDAGVVRRLALAAAEGTASGPGAASARLRQTLRHMPRDWVAGRICQWAESAARSRSARPESAHALLLPWRERVITTGTVAWGTVAPPMPARGGPRARSRADEHLREGLATRTSGPVVAECTRTPG
jgi:hypothetical protein